MSVDAKEASKKALGYFLDMMPTLAQSKEVRLEEIELDKAEHSWLVTFSFPDPQESPYFGGLTPFGVRRLAKVIRVDSEDGSFVALKQFVA
jgi:hypothetical protein